MPGGLRNHRAGREYPRPRHDTPIDRHLQPEGGPADIAHGGEPALKRRPRLAPGRQVHEPDVLGQRRHLADPDKRRVPMRVDQPRNDGPATTINPLGVLRALADRNKPGNPVSLDKDFKTVTHRQGLAVEKPQIGQKQRPARRLRATFARGQTKACEQSDDRSRAGQELPASQVGFDPRVGGERVASATVARLDPCRQGKAGIITGKTHGNPFRFETQTAGIARASKGRSHILARESNIRRNIWQGRVWQPKRKCQTNLA